MLVHFYTDVLVMFLKILAFRYVIEVILYLSFTNFFELMASRSEYISENETSVIIYTSL